MKNNNNLEFSTSHTNQLLFHNFFKKKDLKNYSIDIRSVAKFYVFCTLGWLEGWGRRFNMRQQSPLWMWLADKVIPPQLDEYETGSDADLLIKGTRIF